MWRRTIAAGSLGACLAACALIAQLEDREVAVLDAGEDGTASSDSTSEPVDEKPSCEMCGTSSCVDFTKDSNHCGFCGHSCRGGTCTDGLCPVITVSKLDLPQDLTGDTTTEYVTDQFGVWAVPKIGGPREQINNWAFLNHGVAVSAGRVWVSTPFSIIHTDLDGGSPQLVWYRDGGGMSGVALNGDIAPAPPQIFFATKARGIAVTSTDDAGATFLVPEKKGFDAGFYPSIGLDDKYVYYTVDSELRRVPRTGGASDAIGTTISTATQLSLAGGWIYWGDGQSLRRTSIADGGTEILATGDRITDVKVHQNRIFYSVLGASPNTGAIMTMTQGQKPVPLALNVDSPCRVDVDANWVFWLERVEMAGQGWMRKVPR